MSTPTTPVATATTAKTAVATNALSLGAVGSAVSGLETTGVSWLKAHERIVIVTLVLVAGSWFGDHWLNNVAAKDKQAATVAAQQLSAQESKDTQLASQVSQLNTQYQALVAQLSAQNAQLITSEQSRTVVLQQQESTDKTLPLPALGSRWATLAGVAPTELSATSTGIAVSGAAALSTVEQLEQVPVLTQNLKDETTVADNRQQEVDKANALVSGLNTQVSNLSLTITDDDKACKAQVASVQATANKAKSKWFKFGFVGGFIVGVVTGHKL